MALINRKLLNVIHLALGGLFFKMVTEDAFEGSKPETKDTWYQELLTICAEDCECHEIAQELHVDATFRVKLGRLVRLSSIEFLITDNFSSFSWRHVSVTGARTSRPLHTITFLPTIDSHARMPTSRSVSNDLRIILTSFILVMSWYVPPFIFFFQRLISSPALL